MQQNNKLQTQVDCLLSAITKANVPLPADFQPPAKVTQSINFDYSMPTTVSYKTDDLNNPRLHLDWPAASGVQPFQPDREGSVSPHEQFAKQSNINNIKPLPNLPQGLPPSKELMALTWCVMLTRTRLLINVFKLQPDLRNSPAPRSPRFDGYG